MQCLKNKLFPIIVILIGILLASVPYMASEASQLFSMRLIQFFTIFIPVLVVGALLKYLVGSCGKFQCACCCNTTETKKSQCCDEKKSCSVEMPSSK